VRKATVALVTGVILSFWLSSLSAQPRLSPESVDADANGSLSLQEFAKLPGLYGSWELFSELDRDLSGFVSRDEWLRGFPDANGVRGIAKEAMLRGAKREIPSGFSAHGPSVPRRETKEVDLSALPPKPREEWPALTGQPGVDGTKQRVPRGPPQAQPDEPPPISVAPRKRR
jgi:hypothetical protein